ncbi:MAG: sugar-binding protein [bacterium]
MLLIVILIASLGLYSQPIEIPSVAVPPVIDGECIPEEWSDAKKFDGRFVQICPDFGVMMDDSTYIRILCDKENLYVHIFAVQDTSTFIEVKGTRDNAYAQDGVGIIIDPLGNRKELYMIIVGLSGNIGDFRKRRSNLDSSEDVTWDGNIESAVKKSGNGYSVEMKIPFSEFRVGKSDDLVWNINFYRKIHSRGMQGTFIGMPELSNDAEYDAMFPVLIKGAKTTGKTEITPYGIFGAVIDSNVLSDGDAGFDLKSSVGSSGVINFAFNPDYSQIEGDPIMFDNNLQYALYYSEYRPFFVEETNVFASEQEIYYSRSIQNPFVAGRYTYKDNSLQSGVILAYDREDSLIGNTNAVAGIARISKQIKSMDFGFMALDRYDMGNSLNELVLMHDYAYDISTGNSLSYLLAAHSSQDSSIDLSLENLKENLMFKAQYVIFKNNWAFIAMHQGIGDSFKNDLGYVTWTGKQISVAYIQKDFVFCGGKISRLTPSLQFVLEGDYDNYGNYLTKNTDSLEYTVDAKIASNFFHNGYGHIILRTAKAYWADTYFTAEKILSYAQMNITDKIVYDININGGTRVDYNYLRVGYYSNGASNINFNPFPFITLNTGISYDLFYADTAKYALNSKDVGDAVYQWKSVAADAGISYNPTNSLSIRSLFQRQIARFAPNYYTPEEFFEKDMKIFFVCEYKPSVGNVVYLGGRYPENLIFFKFTHRFTL